MIFTPLKSGHSVESMDIEAFRTDVESDKYLYLLAGTHGDEVEGVYVLKELFEWLKTDHTLSELPVVVIPILNVDGYRMSTRVNSHGVDLNRNYPSKDWSSEAKKEKYNPGPQANSEPENQFLLKLFEKYKPGLVLSFHSWKEIINYNGDSKEIADFLASFNDYEISHDIGYETPGSLGTFLPEEYNCPVITFECPVIDDERCLNDIWVKNEEGLKKLLTSDLIQKYLK